ncbi:MAG: FxLYD domain-containing protein, partial [Lactobacillus sp.]|nr:FxLYD domain-containing protein [Lactobacillus sp.]
YPPVNKVYAALGIKASIPGYGLEFQNVTRNEFEEDYIYKMEIRGFVVNTSKHVVDVPTIQVQMLDKDTNVLQTTDTNVPVTKLAPEGRISFVALVVKPSSFTKYVVLTFID